MSKLDKLSEKALFKYRRKTPIFPGPGTLFEHGYHACFNEFKLDTDKVVDALDDILSGEPRDDATTYPYAEGLVKAWRDKYA